MLKAMINYLRLNKKEIDNLTADRLKAVKELKEINCQLKTLNQNLRRT